MNNKDLLKNIIMDSQSRVISNIWPRSQKIPTDSGKVITLTGVRRSGKTFHLFSLINQLISSGVSPEKLLYFNFDDERLELSPSNLDNLLQAYQELYPTLELSTCYFFFDEVQEAPDWEKFVNRIHASISPNIYITGSNSRLLSQEIATSLRGRTLTFEIYPFSFAEFSGALSGGLNPYKSTDRAVLVNLFEKFMYQGGFPELIRLADDLHGRTLQEYFNVMLFRDLIERYQISNSSALKYFCKRIVGASSGELSVNRIYNDLKSQGFKISKDTLYAFQEQAESIYLARFVNKWSESVVKSENSLKKCYVIDQGLGAALDFKLRQDKGRLLETTVALELLKQGKQITYYQNGVECDFLIIGKQGVAGCIQVCASLADDKTRAREIKGLAQTCRKFGLHDGLIITLDDADEINLDELVIHLIPAWQYFYSA